MPDLILDKTALLAYAAEQEKRVALWGKDQRDAFYSAVGRINAVNQEDAQDA